MPQFQEYRAPTAKTAPGLAGAALLLWALPVLLGGCDAIYDDTKGWANRLEASILQTAHELDEDPDAEETGKYTAETVEPPRTDRNGERTARPVPAQPPSQPAAPPRAELGDQAMPAFAPSEPEGTVADAASGLLVPAPGPQAPAKAKAPQDSGKKAGGDKPLQDGDKVAKSALPPLPLPKPQTAGAVAGKEPPQDASKASEAAPAAKADNGHAMVLHLSSLRSEEAAKREWGNLKRDFPVTLGGLEAEIRRAELGEKGTFYRILAGPLPSPSSAREACAEVKARNVKQYCRVLPVQPAAKSAS
ncbi:SPOR domain-containing protein [Pelagibius sp. CAU 1746]|uniref:SPOR domain-containing protein n=1 Tax=Pelagibius sp. CAU 1746 TaxID=3140370 RepID=UPI00325A86D0